jgi:heme/copper-type cytochrome/quinol oxidase subunit 4
VSEEGSTFWISLTEKLIGIILIIVSIIMFYYTATSTDTLNVFTGLFAFLSVVVLVGGAFLIVVKPPE